MMYEIRRADTNEVVDALPGNLLEACKRAAELAKREGYDTSVVDIRADRSVKLYRGKYSAIGLAMWPVV